MNVADVLKLQALRRAYNDACRATDDHVQTHGRITNQAKAAYHPLHRAEIDAARAFALELQAVQKVIPCNLQGDGWPWPRYSEYKATRKAYGFTHETFEEWATRQHDHGNLNPTE